MRSSSPTRSWSVFDLKKKQTRLAELGREMERGNFWEDSTAAPRTMKEAASLRDEIQSWTKFRDHLRDLKELAALDDDSLRAELEGEIGALEQDLEKRAFIAML